MQHTGCTVLLVAGIAQVELAEKEAHWSMSLALGHTPLSPTHHPYKYTLTIWEQVIRAAERVFPIPGL